MINATEPALTEVARETVQRWPLPQRPRAVVLIGAGGIVNACHLPAYRACGLPVAGIFDIDVERSRETARRFCIPRVFGSLAEMVAAVDGQQVVFDLAIPAAGILATLEQLPEGSATLIQKPPGVDLEQADGILRLVERRSLIAAVNFQMRFAPALLAVDRLARLGVLGRIHDVEMRVNTYTPWHLWDFLNDLPRMEIVYHSIHYVDSMRALLAPHFGDPRFVQARTTRHPDHPRLASVASTLILDFGPELHCTVITHHSHRFGMTHSASHLRVEGTHGCAVARLGVNLDYPRGVPDTLQVNLGDGWREVPLLGSWFPDAFRGPMCNLQKFLEGSDTVLHTALLDAWKTMAVVEACYEADAARGVAVRRLQS